MKTRKQENHWILSGLVPAALALWICMLISCQSLPTSIYVSPGGNDQNQGTEEAPLRSIGQALVMAKAKKEVAAGQSITIILRAGTYYQEAPIVLTPEYAGIHIKAHPKEEVILSGAKKIEAEWKQGNGPLFQAKLSENFDFDQLFINHQKQIRARYPNYDPDILVYHGFAADAIAPERVKTWSKPETGILHAIHSARWGGYHYQIQGLDENGEVLLQGGFQNNRQMGMHTDYRMVENIREELDAPGEWFFDQEEKILYYYPTADFEPADAVVEAPVLDHLIEIKGTEQKPVVQVEISGLTFKHTRSTYMQTKEPLLRSDWTIYRGGAILIEGGEDLRIVHNQFRDLGGNGVFVNNYNRRITIASNHFEQIGASAICFVGSPKAVRSPSFEYHEAVAFEELDRTPGPKTNDYPANCLAHDNLIHDIGYIEKQVAGVQIAMAAEITVSHNTIYNLPRAGINIGDGTWGGHIIEHNDVFNTVLETGDHGAFNSWGRDRFWHPDREKMNEIVEKEPSLILLDAQKTTIIRNNRFRCDHGWDIDLDDGSSNYHIYNNLCLSGGIKLREGFHRIAENNIMINNSFHPHVWFKNSHDVFRKNIVTTWYKPIRVAQWGDEVDYNFFPDQAALEESNALGLDLNGAYGNPNFIAPEKGDFRLEENAAAFKVGFKNFPMDQFGVVDPELKALADAPEIPTLFIEAFQNEKREIFDFLGARVRKIQGLGEQSAAGLKSEAGILIIELPNDCHAARAGLQQNDVIIALNEHSTSDIRKLMEAYNQEKWKATMEVLVVRDQKEMPIEIARQ